ncbi:MAG: COP23 domain-containing protein [Cyanobacteria bacterium P01_F01_bin.143]
MKSLLQKKIVVGLYILIATWIPSQSAKALSNKYFCQEVNNSHGVYARTERGNILLMNFKQDFGQNWPIAQRCEEVALRFQRFSDNGILKFIGAGYLNSEPVLCAVLEKGIPCNSENLLVTLPPGTNPVKAARELMDTRSLAKGKVIDVYGRRGRLETYIDGHTYYDLEVLEKLILQQENSDRLIENEQMNADY